MILHRMWYAPKYNGMPAIYRDHNLESLMFLETPSIQTLMRAIARGNATIRRRIAQAETERITK